MAFEPGGRADKLGNRYEGQWVAWQLLRLLKEEIVSVTVEAIGDAEAGVDLWIEFKSGMRQAHQCKARNGSEECWLVSDLRARGVLARLRDQLDRDPRTEFTFVSGLPATVLGDLCDSARNSPDAESYFAHQGGLQGATRRNAIQQFFEALNLDSRTPQGRAQAFDYLRRFRIAQHPFDDSMRQVLLAMAGLLLTGRPETIIATLCEYAESSDHWGRPIYADELRDYLDSLDIRSKNLAYEGRISPAVLRLQRRLASQAVAQGANRIAVAGGDGTINEVLQAMGGTSAVLNVFPCGTGNGWAKEIGIFRPATSWRRQLRIAAGAVLSSKTATVDLGRISERYFLLNVGLGIDGPVVHSIARKRGRGHHTTTLSYILNAMMVVPDFEGFSVQLDVDGVKLASQAISVVISNTGLYAGHLPISKSVSIDDGYLDVFVICENRGSGLVRYLARAIVLGSIEGAGVVHLRGRRIRVECSRSVMGHVDGEPIRCRQSEIVAAGGALRVGRPIGSRL